jgi:hypothetical protein
VATIDISAAELRLRYQADNAAYRLLPLSLERGEQDSCVRSGRALLAYGLARPPHRPRTAVLWRLQAKPAGALADQD